MKKTDGLAQARRELREKIAGGTYATITDGLLMRMGRVVKRQPNQAFFTETSALVLVFWGTVWAALILFLTESTKQALDDFLIFLPLTLIVYLGVTGTRKYWRMAMSIIANHLLDAIQTLENLRDLEDWLKSRANRRAELVWSILFAVVFDAYFILAAILTGEVIPRLPVVAAFLPMFIQIGMLFYDYFWAINLPVRIEHYQFRLYQADPVSSEMISRLAGLFTAFIFMIGAIAGILTLLLAIFNPMPVAGSIFVVALGWIPLFLAFAVTQNSLRHIIRQGKQKALGEIQSKIEKLQAKDEIPGEETLKHLRALIDYHDYIKSRRDSTLDLQSGLNFLNSLLFPIVGFLLGNLKEFLAFFSK